MKVAIITANTDVYRGLEENQSGETIKDIVSMEGMDIAFMQALPSDKKVLSTVLQRMADNRVADLVLTTGGSGCGPEDCMPEATVEVCDRLVPGISEGIRTHMMGLTKRAMLNRGVSAIRGETLVVNLPGKSGAVKECLKYILPEVIHAVKVIKGAI